MPADINIIDVKCTDIDRKRDRRRGGAAVFGIAELEKIAEDFRLYVSVNSTCAGPPLPPPPGLTPGQ